MKRRNPEMKSSFYRIFILMSLIAPPTDAIFAQEAVEAPVVEQKQVDDGAGAAFVYDDKGKRDPLLPLVSSAGNFINVETEYLLTDLKLEGIMYGANNQSLAIINGKIVRLNDAIGKYVVIHIDPTTVKLKKDGETFELKLKIAEEGK